MVITRPSGEQVRFRSQFTGDHILDAYLESAEKGGRTLADLLDDLFNESGVFRDENFAFRFDPTADKIQVRVGSFVLPDSGWTDITTFFKITGPFNAATTYQNFDILTLTDKDVYIVHGLNAGINFADEPAVQTSTYTTKLIDVSEAREWATKTDGQVRATDHSSKAWAIGGEGVTDNYGAAKEWAIKTGGPVDGANFSAKYWATHTNVVNVSNNIAEVITVAADIARINIVATDIANVNTTATSISDVNIIAAEIGIGKDITVTAANIASVNIVAADITDVKITADSIANVNATGGNISNVNTVAASIADVSTVAPYVGTGNDVTIVAAEIVNNNLQSVAANIASVITTANDLNEAVSEIETIANAITNVDKVGTNIADVNSVAGSIANVDTTAQDIANVNIVAGSITNVNQTGGAITNVNTVATDIDNVNTTAGSIANVNLTATHIADVNTVATEIGVGQDVTVVAANLSTSNTIGTVAGSIANINTTATSIAHINIVATDIAQVNATGSRIAQVNAVASNINNVNTVATNIAEVNTVAGIAADVTIAATNIVDFNNRYLGAQSSAPTHDPNGSALDLGDLYFDIPSNVMKVYGSSGWATATSAINGTANRFKYTAASSQTTFTGPDDNSNILGYDSGYLDVYLNGVRLVNGTDFTATNGTSIVLSSGTTASDILEVVAFGIFALANFSIGDANDVTLGGISEGQFLRWNASNNRLEPVTIGDEYYNKTSVDTMLDNQAAILGNEIWLNSLRFNRLHIQGVV